MAHPRLPLCIPQIKLSVDPTHCLWEPLAKFLPLLSFSFLIYKRCQQAELCCLRVSLWCWNKMSAKGHVQKLPRTLFHLLQVKLVAS